MFKRIVAKSKLLIACLLIVLILPGKAFAADSPAGKTGFATSYDVLYDVDASGVTAITETIRLRNLTSEYYANQFNLTIGATDIFDIKAADPGGLLSVSTEQKNNSTTMGVKFNQQVAGLGKVLSWTISFKTKDFAEKIGKVWEVRAPRISTTSNLESYNLTLSVPQSFGDLSLITPVPKSQSISQGKIFLTFDLNQLKESGVSASFGTNQLFDFNLTYHLQNNNLTPILTNIALPPDTAYQDVIYQRIEPKPLNVTLDNDGNYLAWFRLNRNQKLDISVFGSAKLYTNSKVKNPNLDEVLRKKYTQADKYWEKDNPQIAAKLKEILNENPSEETPVKVKRIYQYVVNSLKYDSSRLKDSIERLGAAASLNNPESSVCMEFTDLFIALTRAAGIPSRELDGYAYSANNKLRPVSLTKDVLHSWPEYWDEKRGWVMVDPTWENTTGGVDYFNKLDLNHFAFVIKGSSSQTPIPAGSYKYKGEDSQDVKVTLAETDFLGHPQLDAQIETLSPAFAGFPITLRVKLTNTGSAFFPSNNLLLKSNKLIIQGNNNQKIGVIPAFGTAQFDFKIISKSLFDTYSDQITVLIGNSLQNEQKFTKDILIKSFIPFQTIPILVAAVIVLMVLIYITILAFHFYKKRSRIKK